MLIFKQYYLLENLFLEIFYVDLLYVDKRRLTIDQLHFLFLKL